MSEEIEWTKADMMLLEADVEMAVDIYSFALDEKGKGLSNTDTDNVLERFKKSGYKSARRLRL